MLEQMFHGMYNMLIRRLYLLLLLRRRVYSTWKLLPKYRRLAHRMHVIPHRHFSSALLPADRRLPENKEKQ